MKRLVEAGYKKTQLASGCFCRKGMGASSAPAVGELLAKCKREEGLEHITAAIREQYTYKVGTDAKHAGGAGSLEGSPGAGKASARRREPCPLGAPPQQSELSSASFWPIKGLGLGASSS